MDADTKKLEPVAAVWGWRVYKVVLGAGLAVFVGACILAGVLWHDDAAREAEKVAAEQHTRVLEYVEKLRAERVLCKVSPPTYWIDPHPWNLVNRDVKERMVLILKQYSEMARAGSAARVLSYQNDATLAEYSEPDGVTIRQ
jgi:hypothetical protein